MLQTSDSCVHEELFAGTPVIQSQVFQLQVIDAAKYCYNELSLTAMDNVNAFSKRGYEKMLQRIRASNPHGGSDIVQQTGTFAKIH